MRARRSAESRSRKKTQRPGDGGSQAKDAPGSTSADSAENEAARTTGDAATKEDSKDINNENDDWDDGLIPKKRRLWQGLDGMAIMTFGVVVPIFMSSACCLATPKRITLLLLNHPLETSIELLLLISIPLATALLWSSLCKNNMRYGLGRGITMGAAIGSAIITAALCVAAMFFSSPELQSAIGTDFNVGFCWIAFLSLAAAATGIYLVNRMRLARDFSAARTQVVVFTLAGMVMAVLAFLGAEARPWNIRLAELKAVSTKPAERVAGLHDLRALNAERELRMECSDPRAAGLSGLFIPLKTSSQRELYFAMTGKPYSFREFNSQDISNMPDDDLKRNIVGEKVPGLSLIRSSMDGAVHPTTLSSTIDWTFVFKNGTTATREARAEINLPPGAVVTNLTLWRHGEAQQATVAAAGKAEGFTESSWQQVNLDSPAIISDLGHGRMLLHCNPILQEEEMKVGITMVIPLKADGARAAALNLPTFIATNFDLKDFNHSLKLHSSGALNSNYKNLSAGKIGNNENVITGTLTDKQLESANLTITTARSEVSKPIVVVDAMAVRLAEQDEKKRETKRRLEQEAANAQRERNIIVMIDGSKGMNGQIADVTKALGNKTAGGASKKPRIKVVPPRYVVQEVKRIAAPAPKHLVVVIDGSSTIKPYASELTSALTKLPSAIQTDVIIASQEGTDKTDGVLPLSKALKALKSTDFVGGQNNLQAMVKAAELAGEHQGGAVLWVHGPQPALNEEIYIMSKYVAAPAFYELQVGSGDTDNFDFFKNHSEIGPFTQVARNSTSLAGDLAVFFSKWQPNSNDYAVSMTQTMIRPDDSAAVSPQEADEVLALNANRQVADLIAARFIRKAARIAVAYNIVTPVSCALIANNLDHPGEAEEASEDTSNASNSSSASPANPESRTVNAISPISFEQAPAAVANIATTSYGSKLQGATNGTIGPQGTDCTYVTGINTAGTVRVNNLANLEALLNIIANMAEIGCALAGVALVINGAWKRAPLIAELAGCEVEVSAGQRIAAGLGLIVLGLMVPGLINWFVASARDANLFN